MTEWTDFFKSEMFILIVSSTLLITVVSVLLAFFEINFVFYGSYLLWIIALGIFYKLTKVKKP